MGRCVICREETDKRLFKEAIVPIYICSKKCFIKYFKHEVIFQETFGESSRKGTIGLNEHALVSTLLKRLYNRAREAIKRSCDFIGIFVKLNRIQPPKL